MSRTETLSLRQVTTRQDAVALAEWLNYVGRERPVVLITIPSGESSPYIDAVQVADAVAELAEVVVMPTSGTSWAFAEAMPAGTQVYGGAGRVYPVGTRWVGDLRAAPLHFAHHRPATRAAERLIEDALRLAMVAGLVDRPSAEAREVTATVQGFPHPQRALVRCDDGTMATVSGELTAAEVPLARVLTVGQRVTGALDPATARLDVRRSIRRVEEAMGDYAAGDVVLVRVAGVEAEELVVEPVAGTRIRVPRSLVTSNDLDALSGLFAPGDVVPARVAGVAGGLRLRLDDIDDDEPIRPAPALLPGGPPWLVPDAEVPLAQTDPDARAAGDGATGDVPAPPPSPSGAGADRAGHAGAGGAGHAGAGGAEARVVAQDARTC